MDTNENKQLFRTSFKGYEKSDVVNYIKNLSEKFDQEISVKEKLAESYLEKLEKAEGELSAVSDENSSLKAKLEQETSEKEALKSEIENFREKIEALEKSISVSDVAVKLEDENEALKNELLALKAQMEKEKIEIADVLIKAEQMSRKLHDEAIASANQQKAAIERQIISKKSELLGLNGEIERMKSIFADLYKKYVRE